MHGRLVSLKQDPTHLHYRVTWPKTAVAPLSPPSSAAILNGKAASIETSAADDTEALLRNYFNLEHDLALLYEQWAGADANFRKRAPKFAGVRILNQDAWEALIGFICSSNNNISRISQMVGQPSYHHAILPQLTNSPIRFASFVYITAHSSGRLVTKSSMTSHHPSH